jgi:hypothetical protein
VIVSVLDRMPCHGALERRLLCAGHLASLWGAPALWDARTSRRVFPLCGTLPSSSPRSPPLSPYEDVPPLARSLPLQCGPRRRAPSAAPARERRGGRGAAFADEWIGVKDLGDEPYAEFGIRLIMPSAGLCRRGTRDPFGWRRWWP